MTRFLTDYELRHRLLKYGRVILLLINSSLVMGGVMLIGCSVWVLDEARGFVMNSFYSTSAILLTLSGLFCIILGIIGCLASQEKAKVPLLMFITGLSVLLMLLIATQVLAFLFARGLHTRFRETIYASAKAYFNSTLIQDSWDVLQSRLKCCGISKAGPGADISSSISATKTSQIPEPFDVWQTNPEFRKENGPAVPESCCVSDLISSFQNYRQFRYQCQGQMTIIHRADCYDRLQEYVRPKVQLVAMVSLSMTLLLSLAIISALLIYQGMRVEADKRQHAHVQPKNNSRTTFVQQPRQRPISVSTLTSENNDILLGESAMTPVANDWNPVMLETGLEKLAIREGMQSLRTGIGMHNQPEATSNQSRIPLFQKQQQQQYQQPQQKRIGQKGGDGGSSLNHWHLEHAVAIPRIPVAEVRNMYAGRKHKHEFSIRRAGNGGGGSRSRRQ